MTIRPASVDEVGEVLAVLDEAASWLRSRHVRQWPERFASELVMPALEAGQTWLANDEHGIFGTMTLTSADALWDDDGDGDALYLHRLAIRRRAAGRGSWLLEQSRALVRASGCRLLRLDCVATNRRLREYYEVRGFSHRGDRTVFGAPGQRLADGAPTPVSLYEAGVAHQD